MSDEYDPAKDAHDSYYAAVEAKRARGDKHGWNDRPWKRMEVIGDCTLYLGDARDIAPGLVGIKAVLTDPPYGIGIAANPVRQKHDKKSWDSAAPDKALFDMLRRISDQQIIWGGNYFELPPSQCFLVWDKVQPEDFSLAMCEQAWASFPSPAKLFRKRVVGYAKSHPTQKPVDLMEWCLQFFADGTVLDPFMGSGTTGVACVKRSRPFVGIEIDPDYFELSVNRIRDAYSPQGGLFGVQAPLFSEAAQ